MFGWNSRRRVLLTGLREGLLSLKLAGCSVVLVDGSFVTAKDLPQDIDVCWDASGVNPEMLDPILLEFADGRAAQKSKFGCEFFIASWDATGDGEPFSTFFQYDRSGNPKGIAQVDLKEEKL